MKVLIEFFNMLQLMREKLLWEKILLPSRPLSLRTRKHIQPNMSYLYFSNFTLQSDLQPSTHSNENSDQNILSEKDSFKQNTLATVFNLYLYYKIFKTYFIKLCPTFILIYA
ncbi:unnamed protein product [Lupinus luteus]|uniref:Uncharacterized protein n=1 Tax=Lupinus luteus TaxID=3873 RepID=A0AAV1Y3R3_LUPLU